MKLTFLGATHEVTGSCFFLEACGKRIIIDCGMEQGPDFYVNQEIPVDPSMVDMAFVTHAHIDHSGLFPLLYKKGFRGALHTTEATADLCSIMLRDSAHIQEFEAEWRNRKGKRAGKEEFIPLYTMEDAEGLIANIVSHPYEKKLSLCEGIEVRFTDAGHLLGSASIEFWITEEGVTKKLVFSGDIGNIHQPLINDPHDIEEADYVVVESTYGDRSHEAPPDYVTAFAEVIQETLDRGGNLVIPSFAVGRTQELLYFIREIKERGLLKGHGDFPVYMDSPLAIEATNIFVKNQNFCYDFDAIKLVKQGINPLIFDGLEVAQTSEDSKLINEDKRPKIIISASGMCDAGRIKHHLKHNLWRPESTVLFVGYQAVGTLGRAIVDGAKKVKILGEEVEIHAQIKKLPGISGHADNEGLIRWLSSIKTPLERVFVVHGESDVCDLFTERLKDQLGLPAVAPYSGARYDLRANTCEVEGVPVPVERKSSAAEQSAPVKTEGGKPFKTRRSGSPAAGNLFMRLLLAGMHVMGVIQKSEGRANRDIGKMAAQLEEFVDQWSWE